MTDKQKTIDDAPEKKVTEELFESNKALIAENADLKTQLANQDTVVADLTTREADLRFKLTAVEDELITVKQDRDLAADELDNHTDDLEQEIAISSELRAKLAAAESERDAALKQVAKISADAAKPAPPVDAKPIKRPKPGQIMKLPKVPVTLTDIVAALDEGDVLVVSLTDSDGRVQPVTPIIAGRDGFVTQSTDDPRVVLIAAFDLRPEGERAQIRAAWLSDADGKVLSECRLSADLEAGGGSAATIPARSFVFRGA